MADPSVNHQEQTHVSLLFNGVSGGNPINGSSAGTLAMNHNPGISMDWSMEEQAVLEDGLAQYQSETALTRYAKIALRLHNKTVRDVALRVRWMHKRESCKKRKDDHNLTRKSKDKKEQLAADRVGLCYVHQGIEACCHQGSKPPNIEFHQHKERVSDPSAKSSHFAARPNVNQYAPPIIPMDNDDGISYEAIGGLTSELLEQNVQALNQISANLSAFQTQGNINLFCQTRDNFLKIMNDLNDQPEILKQMPPIPVRVNEELANSILPRTNLPRHS